MSEPRKEQSRRTNATRPTRAARREANRRQLARFKRQLRARLPELREKYAVASLGVFGSYVRGEARARSDLDILVDFEKPPSLFKLMHLEEELAALLKVKVDVVPRSSVRPAAVGQQILAEVVPV